MGKKFFKILAIMVCAIISVSLFALAACKSKDAPETPPTGTQGEPSDDGDNAPDDSSDGTQDGTTEMEQSDLYGIYDWDVYKLILEEENSAALIINGGAADGRQLRGEWGLEKTTLTATFTEDITAEAAAIAAAEPEPLATITLAASIADDGRVSMSGSVTYGGETKTAAFESPYEPVKNKSEWSDLIGTYSYVWEMGEGSGYGSARIIISENGFFSFTMKEVQVFSIMGYGILEGDNLTLVPYTAQAAGGYINYDMVEVLTVVRSGGKIKLVDGSGTAMTKQ